MENKALATVTSSRREAPHDESTLFKKGYQAESNFLTEAVLKGLSITFSVTKPSFQCYALLSSTVEMSLCTSVLFINHVRGMLPF